MTMTIIILIVLFSAIGLLLVKSKKGVKPKSRSVSGDNASRLSTGHDSTKTNSTLRVSRTDAFLAVDSLGFFGPYATSENKRYTLTWSDADPSGSHGGYRRSGEGRFILFENDQIILQGRMQRPNDGHVANTGTFILNDWGFGDGLKGTFFAMDKHGKVLVQKKFRANLYNNGISTEGKLAVCQTCNSENADSSLLSLFDLTSGQLLWSKHPESGWANSYGFDTTKQLLYLSYNEKGKFAYDFFGGFPDAEKWHTERLRHAQGAELLLIAREHFKSIDINKDTSGEVLSLLERALNTGLDDYPNEKALAYRTIGEVFEKLGDTAKAVYNYERAIELNQKVGIKRRLDALKKE